MNWSAETLCISFSSLPSPLALARQEESAKLLEDKVRRAEAEARELEEQRSQAQAEKDKITKAAQAQRKDNEAAVSSFPVPCDAIDSDVMYLS